MGAFCAFFCTFTAYAALIHPLLFMLLSLILFLFKVCVASIVLLRAPETPFPAVDVFERPRLIKTPIRTQLILQTISLQYPCRVVDVLPSNTTVQLLVVDWSTPSRYGCTSMVDAYTLPRIDILRYLNKSHC
jgi:hypothetical protein